MITVVYNTAEFFSYPRISMRDDSVGGWAVAADDWLARWAMPVNSIPVESESGLGRKLERRRLTSTTRFNSGSRDAFYPQYWWRFDD